MDLTPLQERCIREAASWYGDTQGNIGAPVFYLAGYAGSGKSTVLPYLIEKMGLNASDVAFCAPTGKAAKVMTTKLREVYGEIDRAKTIHSTIYVPGSQKVDMLEKRIEHTTHKLAELQSKSDEWNTLNNELKSLEAELDAAYKTKGEMVFHLNPDAEVAQKKLIVVDEASMVGSSLAEDLKWFNIPILAMGDPLQLPPVKDKHGLTIGKPDFFLDEIHRQALDNPIIWLSQQIRKGINIQHGSHGGLVHIVRPKDDEWTVNMDYNAQVLVGTHKTRYRTIKKIRDAMGYKGINEPQKDELLIFGKNSKNYANMVNGTFAWVTKDVEPFKEGVNNCMVHVEDQDTGIKCAALAAQSIFEDHFITYERSQRDQAKAYYGLRDYEHLDFGYAITGHKSQGSQWDNVIVHDESGVFQRDADKWLYTCVTRAANELILVMR